MRNKTPARIRLFIDVEENCRISIGLFVNLCYHAITLFALFLPFSSCRLNAQQLPLRHYTTDDGLISGDIKTIFQDSRGFLWFGTGDGLSRYDGLSFSSFSVTDGLPNAYVNCITESRNQPGTLLIGTQGGGITRAIASDSHGGLRFESVWTDPDLYSSRVGRIVEDSTGRLWAATPRGVYIVDKGKGSLFLESELVTESDVTASADGDILLGMGRTVHRVDPFTMSVEKLDINVPPDDRIITLCKERNGTLWIATAGNRILAYRDSFLIASAMLETMRIDQILADDQGSIWLCTRYGLYTAETDKVSEGDFTRYSTENGLRGDVIPCALFDRERNLWIGSNRHGVSKWADLDLTFFPASFVQQIHNAGVARMDTAGHFWVAADDGILEIWRTNSRRWNHHLHHPMGANPDPSVSLDPSGRLWVQLPQREIRCFGISRKAGGPSTLSPLSKIALAEHFPDEGPICFIIDRRGLLWCSLNHVGVAVFDVKGPSPRLIRIYPESSGLTGKSVRVIYEDRRGKIWMAGFNEGLSIAEHGADSALTQPVHLIESLPNGGIRSITEDAEGRIWIGTRYGGIVIVDGDTLRSITMNDGLISNAVWSMTRGPGGSMWVGTHKGLQEINAAMQPLIPHREFTRTAVTACGVAGSLVWYATAGSSAIFTPREERPMVPPPVYLTSFLVNSNPVSMTGPLEFGHNRNNCFIEFVGLAFRDEQSIRYRYRLIGAEESWRGPVDRNNVAYAALRPGAYTFEVFAVAQDSTPSISPARLSFSIREPYWEMWWFRLLVLLSVPVMIGAILFRRLSRAQKESRMQRQFSRQLLEAQEAERKRIAGELHDGLGQSLILVQHGLQRALDNAGGDETASPEELKRVSSVAAEAMNEVREISSSLHPHTLDQLGLTKAVSSMVSKASKLSGIPISCDAEALKEAVPRDREIHIYRIIQEGLNNILKHAEATTASVRCSRTDSGTQVIIEDNGKGFTRPTPRNGHSASGIGLEGIAERARILGGRVEIGSRPGNGTILRVRIPFTKSGSPT